MQVQFSLKNKAKILNIKLNSFKVDLTLRYKEINQSLNI